MATINTDLLKKAIDAYGYSELSRRSFITVRHLKRLSEGQADKVLPSTRFLLSRALGVKPDVLFPFEPFKTKTPKLKASNQS